LDVLQELAAARKYIQQFHTKNNITVMRNEVENELYRLRAQGEEKQTTDPLKK
jgi:hypothetical protein